MCCERLSGPFRPESDTFKVTVATLMCTCLCVWHHERTHTHVQNYLWHRLTCRRPFSEVHSPSGAPPPRVRVHFLLMEHQLCPFTSDESWHPAEMSVWMSGRDFGTRVHTTAPKVWGCGWKKATSDTQANWTIKPPVILIKFIFNQDYFRFNY